MLVGWSHKYLEVLEMFELSEYQMDYGELSLENVVEHFRKLVENEETIRTRVRTHLPGVVRSSRRNWELAMGLLTGGRHCGE